MRRTGWVALADDPSALFADQCNRHNDVKKAFGTACRLAAIHNLHWPGLRHTFVTGLTEAGFREATIADLMGHSDPQTTWRYTHATDRTKRVAMEAVRASGDFYE